MCGEIMKIYLREIREERNLSMSKLAKIAGVSKGTLSNIERGLIDPKISTIFKICMALRVSVYDLVDMPSFDKR